MNSVENSPLLSSHELDTPNKNDLSKDESNVGENKLWFVVGILAALLWACCSAASSVCVQVRLSKIIYVYIVTCQAHPALVKHS